MSLPRRTNRFQPGQWATFSSQERGHEGLAVHVKVAKDQPVEGPQTPAIVHGHWWRDGRYMGYGTFGMFHEMFPVPPVQVAELEDAYRRDVGGKPKGVGVNDRRRGCLLGLAVGDALGGPVEFMAPGHFLAVQGYGRGGPHGLEPGEWTDDTSMALALASSIGEKGWDLGDQMDRYSAWMNEGRYSVKGWCFDIGGTTRQSIEMYALTRDPRRCASRQEGDSGNGSIMRLAPVPIMYHRLFPDDLESLCTFAEESSLTTHASEQCLSACSYLACVLAALINGEDRDEVLNPAGPVYEALYRRRHMNQLVHEVARGSYLSKSKRIEASGWVIHTLEAALWAFHDAPDFRTAVLKAVNLGGDADTVGAVCGQLAGATWGESGIPPEWLDGLARKDMIEDAARMIGAAPATTPEGSNP